ncbi:MAG: carbohydrate-binding domain-containing protein [Caldilineaceae bacterium]|nr:carbohydrate-binding domain-containing protein [Caldilineaceae bacterium]
MQKKIPAIFVAALIILALLVSCGRSTLTLPSTTETSATNTSSINTASATSNPHTSTITTTTALANNTPSHTAATDEQWESAAEVPITLQDDASMIAGEGATVDGNIVTITSAGTYRLSGTLTDGQVVVDTKDEEVVRLILSGVNIHHSSNAALAILNAEKVVIVLADQSENYLSDGATYLFPDAETDEPNAALFSDVDLTITGTGALTVDALYNDGIASKDGLVIDGGIITVNAADDGIRGKDYLVINDGQLTINAQGDGLKADEDEDTTKGYITIAAGQFTITAGGDAITADNNVAITGGEFILTTAGGSNAVISEDLSAKGIKAAVAVVIDGGNFTINAADDGLHSNTDLVINGGTFTIASGDDAIHADGAVVINQGEIQITQSYEGIEGATITINDGTIHLVSSDDGINVAGGNDAEGTNQPRGPRGGQSDPTTYRGSNYLYLNGGYIVVDASGDGIDVNGAIVMTGGVVIVNGPTMQMNGALDYDAFFQLTGGWLVAAGSSGMAQAPGNASTQPALLINLTAAQPAGTLVHLEDSAGNDILTFAPMKGYQSIAFSSAELVTGETYTLYLGGSTTGTAQDGLFQGGDYTAGTEYTSFTVNSTVTTMGNTGRR